MKKVRPALRYPGSKFRAYKHIKPSIELVSHDEYREPFFGSGAVYFQKESSKYNWINDIDEELMITYKIISNEKTRKNLISLIEDIKPTKEYFYELVNFIPKNDLEIAFRYFVINRTAYSGIMNKPNWGFHPIKSVQPDKWGDRINEMSVKLKNVKITNIDYKEVITAPLKGKNTLIFVDPPYYKADQKRAYKHSFLEENHHELAEVLKSLDSEKYKFCLTYDDCDEVRDIYSWANILNKEWRYHTSNSNVTTRKMGKELIITNYITEYTLF